MEHSYKYTTDVIVRNYKLHLLIGVELDDNIRKIFEHLDSRFEDLYIKENENFKTNGIVNENGTYIFLCNPHTSNIVMSDTFRKTIYLEFFDYIDLKRLILFYLKNKFPNLCTYEDYKDLIPITMNYFLNALTNRQF